MKKDQIRKDDPSLDADEPKLINVHTRPSTKVIPPRPNAHGGMTRPQVERSAETDRWLGMTREEAVGAWSSLDQAGRDRLVDQLHADGHARLAERIIEDHAIITSTSPTRVAAKNELMAHFDAERKHRQSGAHALAEGKRK